MPCPYNLEYLRNREAFVQSPRTPAFSFHLKITFSHGVLRRGSRAARDSRTNPRSMRMRTWENYAYCIDRDVDCQLLCRSCGRAHHFPQARRSCVQGPVHVPFALTRGIPARGELPPGAGSQFAPSALFIRRFRPHAK